MIAWLPHDSQRTDNLTIGTRGGRTSIALLLMLLMASLHQSPHMRQATRLDCNLGPPTPLMNERGRQIAGPRDLHGRGKPAPHQPHGSVAQWMGRPRHHGLMRNAASIGNASQ